jgi:hypothetical protein
MKHAFDAICELFDFIESVKKMSNFGSVKHAITDFILVWFP